MSDAENPTTSADDDDRAKVERLLHEQTHGSTSDGVIETDRANETAGVDEPER